MLLFGRQFVFSLIIDSYFCHQSPWIILDLFDSSFLSRNVFCYCVNLFSNEWKICLIKVWKLQQHPFRLDLDKIFFYRETSYFNCRSGWSRLINPRQTTQTEDKLVHQLITRCRDKSDATSSLGSYSWHDWRTSHTAVRGYLEIVLPCVNLSANRMISSWFACYARQRGCHLSSLTSPTSARPHARSHNTPIPLIDH